MLKVIAEEFIKPEYIDIVMPLYEEIVIKSKAEPLCIAYDLFHDNKELGRFVFIEEWPDQQALDAHTETEHFKRIVPEIAKYERAKPTFTKLSPFNA